MRIISGIYKSRTLQAPKGDQTRPTSDRARETLFNILVNMTEIEDARVLDLFAGSGAFALEAISRGASSAVCLEKAPQAVSSINLNAMNLGIGTELQIIRSDVYKWLLEAEGPFDVIFCKSVAFLYMFVGVFGPIRQLCQQRTGLQVSLCVAI